MMREKLSGLFRIKTISFLVFRFFHSLLSLSILCIFIIKYVSCELYSNQSKFYSGQFHRCCQSLLLQAECLHHLLSSLFCDGCCWYNCIIYFLLAQNCWYQKTKQKKCWVIFELDTSCKLKSKYSIVFLFSIFYYIKIMKQQQNIT